MTPDEARALLDGTTPGPWVRRRDADGNPTPVVVSAGPTDRHHIMTAEPAASPERQQADTALIAAAPALAATIAGMRPEYAVRLPDGRSVGAGWGTYATALEDMSAWRRGGYDARVVRRYVTEPEEA